MDSFILADTNEMAMKTNVIRISTPEAIAMAQRLEQLKRERREASQKRWADGKIKADELKPATFNLKRRNV